MNNILKYQIIMFIVMTIVGICFNAMNALAFSISHLYFSYGLFYGGCLMASNMIWAHEIIHYLVHVFYITRPQRFEGNLRIKCRK